MSKPAVRSITETPNELTSKIDIASPLGIVRLLRSADAQIFGGYGGFTGMNDPETHDHIAALANTAADILRSPNGRVVLSGAGTSGRLAMFTARTFNRFFATEDNPQPFRYTIAGTDLALIAAQEGAEDNAQQGIADLVAASEGAGKVFYVGITCGLSAPYIAGQLAHMLDGKQDGHAVLLGFNPVELARDTAIESWDGSFKDIAVRTAGSPNATVLNPIVGPEPITGSTRMKSGSATKILLETLFHAARAASDEPGADEADRIAALGYVVRVLLADYEAAIREAYMPTHALAELIDAGGHTLNAGGHIYYIGSTSAENLEIECHHHHHDDDEDDDAHDGEPHVHFNQFYPDAGILGLVDASECPPTYGASFDDVRGYLTGGWDALLPNGPDLTDQGENFRVSVENFISDKLPSLTRNDLVVFLGNFANRDELVEQVNATGAQTAAIIYPQTGPTPGTAILVEIAPPMTTISAGEGGDSPEIFDGPPQLAMKLVLNALTTGAHILKGKVYGNRMVDLRISNNKLFFRTVGIIQDLIDVEESVARESLIKSVYQTDTLTAEQIGAPISDHIEASKPVPSVVPIALLLATGKFNHAQAVEALKNDPIVRNSIETHAR